MSFSIRQKKLMIIGQEDIGSTHLQMLKLKEKVITGGDRQKVLGGLRSFVLASQMLGGCFSNHSTLSSLQLILKTPQTLLLKLLNIILPSSKNLPRIPNKLTSFTQISMVFFYRTAPREV